MKLIQFLAIEIFTSLPDRFCSLSAGAIDAESKLDESSNGSVIGTATMSSLIAPLPLSVADSLVTFGVVKAQADVDIFLAQILRVYVGSGTAQHATAAATDTKPEACELCERSWIPLTQHHLVPRAIASKAVKRGWVDDRETSNLAWLCRACHNFVHRMASHEELAKDGRSIQQLLDRHDIQKWVSARVRAVLNQALNVIDTLSQVGRLDWASPLDASINFNDSQFGSILRRCLRRVLIPHLLHDRSRAIYRLASGGISQRLFCPLESRADAGGLWRFFSLT